MPLNNDGYPVDDLPNGVRTFFDIFGGLDPGDSVACPNEHDLEVRLGLGNVCVPDIVVLSMDERLGQPEVTADLVKNAAVAETVTLDLLTLDDCWNVLVMSPHDKRDMKVFWAAVALRDAAVIAKEGGVLHPHAA